jgi:dUTP pyrophosphatase
MPVRAGLSIHIKDPGLCGIITPRSGLGSRGLVLGNTVGVIDSDYIGPILLTLMNRGLGRLTIDPMMRVAQLLIVPVMRPQFYEVADFHPTARGTGGFGSTGVL